MIDPVSFMFGIATTALIGYIYFTIDLSRLKKQKQKMDKDHELESKALNNVRLKSRCDYAKKLGIPPDEYIAEAEKMSKELDIMIKEEKKKLSEQKSL